MVEPPNLGAEKSLEREECRKYCDVPLVRVTLEPWRLARGCGACVLTMGLLLYWLLYWSHYLFLCADKPDHWHSMRKVCVTQRITGSNGSEISQICTPRSAPRNTLQSCHSRSLRYYLTEFIELPRAEFDDARIVDDHESHSEKIFQVLREEEIRDTSIMQASPSSVLKRVKKMRNDWRIREKSAICKDIPMLSRSRVAGVSECARNGRVSLVLLIGQRRGGTNWAEWTLEGHPQITTLHEVSQHWFKVHCTRLGWYGAECSSLSMIKQIHNPFEYRIGGFVRSGLVCNSTSKDETSSLENHVVLLSKVEIEQFLYEHYADVSRWAFCNGIRIVHWRRASSVGSFWSYQADTVERMHTRQFRSALRRPRNQNVQRAHITELTLVPQMSVDYVTQLDRLHETLKLFLKFSPLPLAYREFFYEDLIGPYGSSHWDALQTYLSVKVDPNLVPPWIVREHPMPCFSKIVNWDVIKQSLKGTDSYYACEMEFS